VIGYIVDGLDGQSILTLGMVNSSQSVDTESQPSSLALDGDMSTFSLTGVTNCPWLKVDLQSYYVVHAVEIFNRGMCCSNHLSCPSIRLSGHRRFHRVALKLMVGPDFVNIGIKTQLKSMRMAVRSEPSNNVSETIFSTTIILVHACSIPAYSNACQIDDDGT